MDKTLVTLFVLSLVLIGLLAPYAMLTVASIFILSAVSTWGSWALLQGFGQSQPQAQTERIWD